MTKLINFDSLDVGECFFDPETCNDFEKVCGNAAELLLGLKFHSGNLMTFEPNDLVLPFKK